MMHTTEVIDSFKAPTCTYSVRRGAVDGPLVQYATVGEPVLRNYILILLHIKIENYLNAN
jgi:hypothetical protein